MSLSGCAPERELSSSEKVNALTDILNGTSAAREARESEIARENMQIYLMSGILVAVVIVALILIFRKKALPDSPSIATLAQTKSSESGVFLSFWFSLKSLRFDRKMFWISVSMCLILLAVYLPVLLSFFGL